MLDACGGAEYLLFMPAAQTAPKFTARNLPALISLARDCGLEHSFRHDGKCYSFAPNALDATGDWPAASDEDHAKLARFVAAADAMFGTRESFCAYSAHRFARVTWRRSSQTESQRNNCD